MLNHPRQYSETTTTQHQLSWKPSSLSPPSCCLLCFYWLFPVHTCSVPHRLQSTTVQNTLDKILGKQHNQNNLEEKNGKDQRFRVFFLCTRQKNCFQEREEPIETLHKRCEDHKTESRPQCFIWSGFLFWNKVNKLKISPHAIKWVCWMVTTMMALEGTLAEQTYEGFPKCRILSDGLMKIAPNGLWQPEFLMEKTKKPKTRLS